MACGQYLACIEVGTWHSPHAPTHTTTNTITNTIQQPTQHFQRNIPNKSPTVCWKSYRIKHPLGPLTKSNVSYQGNLVNQLITFLLTLTPPLLLLPAWHRCVCVCVWFVGSHYCGTWLVGSHYCGTWFVYPLCHIGSIASTHV